MINLYEVSYHINSAVRDNLGKYGEPLTDFQKGYNDAVEQYRKESQAAKVFMDSFDEDTKEKIMWLLNQDHAYLNIVDDNSISFLVNANDTFAYACADCEELKKEDIADYYRLCRQYGHDGSLTWLCLRRDELPLLELADGDFRNVYNSEKAKREK
jgi:hypothetical protein